MNVSVPWTTGFLCSTVTMQMVWLEWMRVLEDRSPERTQGVRSDSCREFFSYFIWTWVNMFTPFDRLLSKGPIRDKSIQLTSGIHDPSPAPISHYTSVAPPPTLSDSATSDDPFNRKMHP